MLRPPGSLHDHVGTHAPLLADGRHLLLEIAVLQHAGQLDDPAQLDLPPAPAHGRRPQRGHQVAGGVAQLFLRRRDGLHLLADGAVGRPALQLHRPHLRVHLLQRRADRPDHPFDRLLLGELAGLQLGRRLFPNGAKLFGGQRQEILLARAKRFPGHRLKRVAKLRLRRLEQRALFVEAARQGLRAGRLHRALALHPPQRRLEPVGAPLGLAGLIGRAPRRVPSPRWPGSPPRAAPARPWSGPARSPASRPAPPALRHPES